MGFLAPLISYGFYILGGFPDTPVHSTVGPYCNTISSETGRKQGHRFGARIFSLPNPSSAIEILGVLFGASVCGLRSIGLSACSRFDRQIDALVAIRTFGAVLAYFEQRTIEIQGFLPHNF